MSPLLYFLAFLRRFAPFWLVWLLILTLPASREPLRLQLLGSPLTPEINPPWQEVSAPDRRLDAFAAAARNPDDLNARLWRLSQMLDGKAAGWSEVGDRNTTIYSPATLRREAEAIRDEFPDEKWLISLPVRVSRLEISSSKQNPATASRLVKMLSEAARLEPQNAYYPLLEAYVLDLNNQRDAALQRAAQGKIYDSHDLEWSRAIIRAHEAARPLIFEEKAALWNQQMEGAGQILSYWPSLLADKARRAQKRGDHRRAIKIGVILGSIGDLMQRGKNSLAVAESGHNWKMTVNELVWRTYPPKPGTKPQFWARDFETYAAAYGRPDVRAMRKKWLARQQQVPLSSAYAPTNAPAPPKTAAQRVEKWKIAGLFFGSHLLLVAAGYLLVNAILWRGVGAPSTSRERLFPALFMMVLTLFLALWSWRQIEILDPGAWSPTKERYIIAVGTVAVAAFFGAPFLLAVWAAGATLWRHKVEFLKPARIDTELRLNLRQIRILHSGPALFCVASLVFTLFFWLLYLALIAFGVANFDALGWLPDDGRITSWSLSMPTEALFAPLVYCLFLDFACFVLWFNKWRYYAGQEARPITHGGLRSWKEMLGIYLVLGSAVYLGVALFAWPIRAQANREFEIKLVRGELPQ